MADSCLSEGRVPVDLQWLVYLMVVCGFPGLSGNAQGVDKAPLKQLGTRLSININQLRSHILT